MDETREGSFALTPPMRDEEQRQHAGFGIHHPRLALVSPVGAASLSGLCVYGWVPRLTGGEVRTNAEIDRIRADIERLWLGGHDLSEIARYTWLSEGEVELQLAEMREIGTYDVRRLGGFDIRGGRVVPYRSKWPKRRRRRNPATEPS